MQTEIVTSRLPRVQIWRRGAAFAIDWLTAWLVATLLGGQSVLLQSLLFLLTWLSGRWILVYRNQGQSLGRWVLDMKVVDARLGRVPGLQALLKREALTGFGALLAMIGLNNFLLMRWGWTFVLFVPLLIDCGSAIADSLQRQTFHDRWARTLVTQTHRGYSLDLKMKRLLAQVRDRVKK